jgi:parallel beta-helix repeat protein
MKTIITKKCVQILLGISVSVCAMAGFGTNTLQAQALTLPSCPTPQGPALQAQKKHTPKKAQAPVATKKKTQELQLEETYSKLEQHAKQVKSKPIKAALVALSKITREIHLASKSKTLTVEQIEKGITLAEATDEKMATKSSSSSCCHSLKRLLIRLINTLINARNQILEEIEELSEHLECLQRTVIDQLPTTIRISGSYCLKNSLFVSGPQPAITVEADNVDIDLGDHVITLAPTVNGIVAQDTTNLRIHNGTITSSVPSVATTNIGIFLTNVTHGEFTDIIFSNTLEGYVGIDCVDQSFVNCKFDHEVENTGARGILIEGGEGFTITNCYFGAIGPLSGSDLPITARAIDVNVDTLGNPCNSVSISDCQFTNSNLSTNYTSSSTAIYLLGTTNVEIENCEMQNSDTDPVNAPEAAITIAPTCAPFIPSNISIRNCDIFQAHVSGICAFSYDNLLVENCRITAASDNDFNCMQLGNNNNSTLFISENATIRGCSFSNPFNTSNPDFDNCIICGSEGVLIENGTFDAQIPGDAFNANLNIIPDVSGQSSKTVHVLNCTFSNVCPADIIIVDSSAVIIDNCIMSQALSAGVVLLAATGCTVKNCEVSNIPGGIFSGAGIQLRAPSHFNQIYDNTVTNCNGDGIQIFQANNNTIKNNTCSNNTEVGIDNISGINNEFYFNTACNNGITDCVNVTPAQAPGASPAVAGSNICCTSATSP